MRGRMRSFLVIGCALLAACPAQAQDETLRTRLRALGVAAEALENKLPAFACRESLTSQEIRKGKVKRQIQAIGDLRVRTDADGQMDERFTPTEVNGHPYKPGSFHPPLFVSGGFRHALGQFRPQDQPCFDFRLAGNRIDYTSRPNPSTEACDAKSGISGFALFDNAGNLLHIEQHMQEDAARQHNIIPFATLDLTQINLGDATLLLSTHVIAEKHADESTYRWEATYSACRLFEATVTIGDPTPVPDAPAK